MRWKTYASGIAAVTLLTSTALVAQENSGKKFELTLTGAVEVPVPGDPDGTGSATIRINPGQGQLCYTLTVSGIAPATAAHIHEAPAGAAGKVVLGLAAPTDGTSEGCISISRELAKEIMKDPGDYYINVHNAEFPGGALRAQLDM
jgi:hypothetical protein